MHPFDEWFNVTYPHPQPAGTRETALIAWNAAIHAAREFIRTRMLKLVDGDELVEECRYERAAELRDCALDLAQVSRVNDK